VIYSEKIRVDVFILPIATIIFCIIGDCIVRSALFNNHIVVGIVDNLIHGIIGFLIVLPYSLINRPIKLRFPLLAMTVAMLLDLDHFAAAHSFSISDAISIEAYPGTHSLTMAVIFPSIIYVWKHNFRVTWIVFLALLSHVIRDAGLWGVPLFFPFSGTIKVPYGLYLLVILALQQISKLFFMKEGTCTSYFPLRRWKELRM